MNEISNLIFNIVSEIGTPIYNAKIVLINERETKSISTNISGIAGIDLEFGTYIVQISANEFIKRKFKIKVSEKCSFVSLKLKSIANVVYGYILQEEKKKNIRVNLLYEVSSGNYIKVLDCLVDEYGKYEFKNIPRGKYRVEAEE